MFPQALPSFCFLYNSLRQFDFYVMPSVLIGFYSLLLNIGPTYERKRDFCLSEIDVIALI